MSETVTDSPASHYIFQWNTTQHRYVGPFAEEADAVQWIYDFDPTSKEARWLLCTLSENEATAPPRVVPVSRYYPNMEFSLTTDRHLYFVMTYDDRNALTFHGDFDVKNDALMWSYGWEAGRDADIRWQIRHLVGSSLSKPIEIVDPHTQDLQPLPCNE